MTTTKIPESVQSVSEFVSLLQQGSRSQRLLFRGQNTDKPLLPKLVRLAQEKGITPDQMNAVEQKMLERFRRESIPMLGTTKERTDWELLSVAQHHRMPTRLLDWTSSALVGLWFAVASDPPNREKHGVVWIIDNPNEKKLEPSDNIFDLEKTYFFQPFHIDRRIVAQSAWFSIYRHNRTEFLPLERQKRYDSNLKCFILPRQCFERLRQELRLLGVSQATLFPDLEGLGADIQAEFLDSWRPLTSM